MCGSPKVPTHHLNFPSSRRENLGVKKTRRPTKTKISGSRYPLRSSLQDRRPTTATIQILGSPPSCPRSLTVGWQSPRPDNHCRSANSKRGLLSSIQQQLNAEKGAGPWATPSFSLPSLFPPEFPLAAFPQDWKVRDPALRYHWMI